METIEAKRQFSGQVLQLQEPEKDVELIVKLPRQRPEKDRVQVRNAGEQGGHTCVAGRMIEPLPGDWVWYVTPFNRRKAVILQVSSKVVSYSSAPPEIGLIYVFGSKDGARTRPITKHGVPHKTRRQNGQEYWAWPEEESK